MSLNAYARLQNIVFSDIMLLTASQSVRVGSSDKTFVMRIASSEQNAVLEH
jgi:hypothetical protein